MKLPFPSVSDRQVFEGFIINMTENRSSHDTRPTASFHILSQSVSLSLPAKYKHKHIVRLDASSLRFLSISPSSPHHIE